MLFAAKAVKIVRHIIVSDWKRVMAAIFFSVPECVKKQGGVQYSLKKIPLPWRPWVSLSVLSRARLVTGGTNGKVRQGLDHL